MRDKPEQLRDVNKPEKTGLLFELFFVKRIVALLIVMLLTVGGLATYFNIVRENMPDLKVPFATVQTEWVGGDPETIEKRITNKLEEKIKGVADLKRYESASYNSFSVISVEFYADADVDECINNLRAEVDKVDDLPDDAKKPVVTKLSVNDTPILTINLYGDINTKMKNRAARGLKDALLMIPGVRAVTINGERKDEIFVLLHNDLVQKLKLSPETVRDAIINANVDMPLDDIESDTFSPAIKLKARFRDINDLRNLTVTRINNRPILLREIAEVRRDLKKESTRIRVGMKWQQDVGYLPKDQTEFKETLSLDILRSPGADTVRIIEKAKSVINEFRNSRKWPAGLNTAITDDQSITINDSLRDIVMNGFQAIGLVFLVLLVALTWREALVAGLSIPVTLLGVLVLLPLFGYTLNQMAIVAMVMALGMLVDVFILVMEGMHENIFAKNMTFREAATATVKTYALPALSGQLTTIFAFMPLAFIGGVDGKFIRIIPVVVSVTLLLSFIVAMVVDVPVSWFVFRNIIGMQVKKTRVDRLTERMEVWYRENVAGFLLKSRKRSVVAIGLAVLLFIGAVFTAQFLQNEMYPKTDSMTLGATIELNPSTTLEQADLVAKRIGELLRGKNYFESIVSYTGLRSPMAQNATLKVKEAFYLVGFGCRFLPKRYRDTKLSYKFCPELRREIEAELAKIAPGSQLQFHIDTGGASGKAPIELRLSGNDMSALRTLSRRIQGIMRTIAGTVDVNDNLGPAKFAIDIKPDREAMDFYKITADSLGKQLRYATGADEIDQYPAEDEKEELKVRLGSIWPSRKGKPGGPMLASELVEIMVFPGDGKESIPMISILSSKAEAAPLSITHFGGNRTVLVTADTNNRPAEEIIKDLESAIDELKKDGQWPAGCDYSFGGEMESMAETYGSLPWVLLIAFFLVFSVLALQFGNFKQPLIIMSALPLALTGVIFGFFYCNISFSFPAMIGIVSLIGIAVNDTIVMIETMNTLRDSGLPTREAAIKGGGMRLRPIIVTTVTTVAGLVPLMLSDPMWQPLCAAIIFGLVAATFISLIIVPCLYDLFTSEPEKTT